mmetsp:Transcript_17674/g.44143  ORF Transcript_17674/g.44143 Transcript_17674/m.44143 type:complete len:212 (+) Transcript_17674:103-738(+)
MVPRARAARRERVLRPGHRHLVGRLHPGRVPRAQGALPGARLPAAAPADRRHAGRALGLRPVDDRQPAGGRVHQGAPQARARPLRAIVPERVERGDRPARQDARLRPAQADQRGAGAAARVPRGAAQRQRRARQRDLQLPLREEGRERERAARAHLGAAAPLPPRGRAHAQGVPSEELGGRGDTHSLRPSSHLNSWKQLRSMHSSKGGRTQ